MKREVVAHGDPKSPISEIFRTLRTNIQFINTDEKTKTLLVTSTLPGEGKSWIASNLAVTFAQTGKKVVIVDADMRKGRQYTIFDTPPTPGLSNYLSQVGISKKENITDEILDCIRKTEVPNLYLMPAGSIPPNPSELLVSPKMIKLLDKLKQAFDIVIIDGTPCELVTDAVILSRIVDSTIIVTAHKLTKKDALERAIKSIQNVGGKLTGVVVNKMPISGKKYKKKYYYYGESSNRLEDNIMAKEEEPEVTKKERKKLEKTGEEEKPKPTKRKAATKVKEDTKTKESTKVKADTKAKATAKTKADTKPKATTKTKADTKAKEVTKTKTDTKVKEATKTTGTKKKTTKAKETKTETLEMTQGVSEAIQQPDEPPKGVNQKPKEQDQEEKSAKDKTNDILKKMNEYLEKEKAKKEEKGEEND